MPDNRWTITEVPASGYAFDANYWNSLIASNRNLDFLYYAQFTSDAHLELSFSGTIASGTTFTTIPWNTAVSQNYTSMWSNLDSANIFLDTNTPGYASNQGLWGIRITYSYTAATADTDRACRFVFAGDTNFTVTDTHVDSGTASQQHTFFMPWLSGKIGGSNSFQFSLRHSSGTNETLTANIFVTKIPSPVNNFFTDIN